MSLLLRRRMLLAQQKKSSNLFDIDKFVENALALGAGKDFIHTIDNGFFVQTMPYGEQKTRIDFGFEANTQYTISFDYETVRQDTEGKGYCAVRFYYDDESHTQIRIFANYIGYKNKTTMTSKSGKNVIAIAIGDWAYNAGFNFTNIMLNEGTEALPYESY